MFHILRNLRNLRLICWWVWLIVSYLINATRYRGWMNRAYSLLSTTHGHITDCKLVCMYWTRLVLVRPAASLYSASPLDGSSLAL